MFHPVAPTPIYMYYWPAMQAVDVIHRALADALPEAVPAGSGGDLGSFLPWRTEDDGTFWADGFDHLMGQGASHDGDGRAPLMHITGSGIRSTPVEVIEARRPFLVERYELAQDSGGAGRFRGGPGIDVHYRVLRDVFLTLPWERTKTPPWGLQGGHPGRPNRFRVRNPDGSTQEHGKATGLRVGAGAVMEVSTGGGGGGFGPPHERELAAIEADIREGYVSAESARRDYPQLSQRGRERSSSTH
jgi:N-methylhydantoinase B